MKIGHVVTEKDLMMQYWKSLTDATAAIERTMLLASDSGHEELWRRCRTARDAALKAKAQTNWHLERIQEIHPAS